MTENQENANLTNAAREQVGAGTGGQTFTVEGTMEPSVG